MRLAELVIRDYLAYEEATLTLPEYGLAFLVGPNNAGKSALLSAIDRLVNNEEESSIIRDGAGFAVLTATFELNAEDRHSVLGQLADGNPPAAFVDSEAFRWIRLELKQASQPGPMYVSDFRISDSGGEIRRAARPNAYGSSDWQGANPSKWVRGGNPQVLMDPSGQIIGPGPHALEQGRLKQFTWFTSLLKQWRDNTYHLFPLRPGTDPSRPANATSRLLPSGENLPEVLLWLLTNRPRQLDRINEVMQTMVPGLGSLATPTEAGQVRAVFEENDGQRNIKVLGRGAEQLLMAAVIGVTQPSPSLLILEEPEMNLHSEAQRWLLEYLREWSQSRQLVVETHSAVFLDRAGSTGSDVWLIERRSGSSTLRRADESRADVLAALGVRLSDILSAAGILLAEGPSDAAILRHWFGDRLHKANVVIQEAAGGDKVWSVTDLKAWIEVANTLPQSALFIRDRDELDARAVKRLNESPHIHLLSRRELENFLLDSTAILAVLNDRRRRARKTDLEWTALDVEHRMRVAADSVAGRVLARRLQQRFGTVRVLSRADNRYFDTHPPITEAKAVARVKANLAPVENLSAAFEEEKAGLEKSWPKNWLALAPGSDVLEELWREAELKYDKGTDGLELAKKLAPPLELVDTVSSFIEATEGRQAED